MGTKLAIRAVELAQPSEKPYEISDSDMKGLLLRVQPSGMKSYIVTWGRGKRRTLGQHPVMTLAGTRCCLAALSEASQHGAPLVVVAPKSELTVADACRDYVTALEKDGRKTASDDASAGLSAASTATSWARCASRISTRITSKPGAIGWRRATFRRCQ